MFTHLDYRSQLSPIASLLILDDSTHQVEDGNECHHSARVSNLFALSCAPKSLRQGVYLQLYYRHIPFRGKKSSSRPSVDTSKATYIQCRRSLLHSSSSTSGLTISASTHLRNLYISKKIPSLCRYQVYTLDSSNLSLLTSTPTILVYENERNLKLIDAFDVKPIGGDSPRSLLKCNNSTPMKNSYAYSPHEYVMPSTFDDRIRPANLLPIHMLDFDVILGMDFLEEKLYAKFSKCRVLVQQVISLVIFVSATGHLMDPSKVEAITSNGSETYYGDGDWCAAPILTLAIGFRCGFSIYSGCIEERFGLVFECNIGKVVSTLSRQLKELMKSKKLKGDGELWAIVARMLKTVKHTEFIVDDDGVVCLEDLGSICSK
ncbi:hypothetical protein Tco_1483134 [Tanacetum coccineum]